MRKRIKRAVDVVTGGRKPRGRGESTESITDRMAREKVETTETNGGRVVQRPPMVASGGFGTGEDFNEAVSRATEKAIRADLADARAELKEKSENAADLVKTVDRMQAELADAKADAAKAWEAADGFKRAREKLSVDLDAARGLLAKRDKEIEASRVVSQDLANERDEARAERDDAQGEADEIKKRVADLEKKSADIVRGSDPLHGHAPKLPAVPIGLEEQARKVPHVSAARGQILVVDPEGPDWPQHDEDGCARRGGRCAFQTLLGEVRS